MMRLLIIALIVFAGSNTMAQQPPSISVTSNNQQGGITAYQVNIGRVDLTFDRSVLAEIEKLLPKGKPVDIEMVGSPRDQGVGRAYAAALQDAGYTFRNIDNTGVKSPPPDYPITVTTFPDHSELLISPRS